MTLGRTVVLALLLSPMASPQAYTVNTLAGGRLPVNIPGTSAYLPSLHFAAADATGNVYFHYEQTIIMRWDCASGLLTLFAGTGVPGYSGDNGPAALAQLNGPGGLAFDAAGNLYFSDSLNNRIRKISNGIITTIAGNGTPGVSGDGGPALAAQIQPSGGLAVDSAGNVYFADRTNSRIRKISNGIITAVAGNGTAGFSGDGGSATAAQLNGPDSVAVDSSGTTYICDLLNYRIRKVSNGVISTVAGGPSTGLLPNAIALDPQGGLYIAESGYIERLANGIRTTVSGSGSSGFKGDGGPAAAAMVSNPQGICVDSSGNVYVMDYGNGRIRRISKGIITTVAGGGVPFGFSGDNGPATSASLVFPTGVALDAAGDVYFSAYHRVVKVSNGVLTTVAGNDTAGFGGDGGLAVDSQLYYPAGVALDSVGNLYIADRGNNRVRKVSNGIITTVAGNGTLGDTGPAGDNGPATAAQLCNPGDVKVDAAGDLYIANSGANRVRKVSNGRIVTVAGTGGSGFSGDNGPALNAQVSGPQALAIDSTGSLYIADNGSRRIRRVSNGVISTVPGGNIAGLGYVQGIAVDNAGSIFVSDSDNNYVRKISNGAAAIIAGTSYCGSVGDNGPATSAYICHPSGLTVNSAGNVFVAEQLNGRIRVLSPTGFQCHPSVSPSSLEAPSLGGELTVTIQGAGSCPWRVSGLSDWMSLSTTSSLGSSVQLVLSVAANSGSARSVLLSIADNLVRVSQSGPPSIATGGIVNAASSAPGASVAAGSIAAVYGNFPLTPTLSATAVPLPRNLGGFTLQQFASGLTAPLFAVSSGQANFQVPWELAGQSSAQFVAIVGSQTTAAQTFNLAPFAPGIFTMNGQGTGQAAALDASYRLVDASNPANAGSTVIQIYCTGLGAVYNQPETGSPASVDQPSATVTTPRVTIGDAAATVVFSGLAPGSVGEYQINVLVPEGSSKGTAVPITIQIGSAISNTATIAVQ